MDSVARLPQHPAESGTPGQSTLSARLAMQIIELVRRENLPAEAHLREEWLADHLRVSRSPIRKAMNVLGEFGILRKERKRGFFLAKAGNSLSTTMLGADSDVEEQAYLKIADDQLNGRVSGGFTRIDIARHYQLSPRQTLRILTRLEKEGLISPKPGLGWEFHPVLATVEALRQSYRFRMIIEPAAILEPSYEVNKKAFSQQRRILSALIEAEGAGYTRVDLNRIGSDFHETIVASSGNVYLLEALQRQNRMRRLMEHRGHPGQARSVEQAREHLMLLDMLEAGERSAAADFLRQHLDAVRIVKTGV